MQLKDKLNKNELQISIQNILDALVGLRPRKEVEYRPFDGSQGIQTSGPLRVDLKKFYPNAKYGDICYVATDLKCVADRKINLWIWGNAQCIYNDEIIYDYLDVKDYDAQKGGLVRISVKEGYNRIVFMVRCDDDFAFSFMPAIFEYKWWTKDYIWHSRATSPIPEFRGEDGVGISRLYKADEPFDGEFVYPKPIKEDFKVDFNRTFPNTTGGFAYALTYATDSSVLNLIGDDISVSINGETVNGNTMNVKKGDCIIVKAKRNDMWSFSYNEDACIGIPFLHSHRNAGDKWLLLGTFNSEIADIDFTKPYTDAAGIKTFWRLSGDNMHIRPYLDTCFFAQWFYANMVGVYGILNVGQVFNNTDAISYFYDSMKIMATYYEYCRYETEYFGEPTFLKKAMKLGELDYIGTMGMNFVEAYKLCENKEIAHIIDVLEYAVENNVPRFDDGTYYRVYSMWADDIFMSCPFLTRLGLMRNDAGYFDKVLKQLLGFKKRLYMEDKKIYSHIFLPEIGLANRVPWGRGNGWIFNALSDACVNIPDSFTGKRQIEEMFVEFAYGIKALQDESGLWHQVLDCEDSYLETSASAMFLLGIARGIKIGLLKENDFYDCIINAYEGIINKCIDSDGNVYGVCRGSGFSMDKEYYKTLGTIKNDDHGTGVVLSALSELYNII